MNTPCGNQGAARLGLGLAAFCLIGILALSDAACASGTTVDFLWPQQIGGFPDLNGLVVIIIGRPSTTMAQMGGTVDCPLLGIADEDRPMHHVLFLDPGTGNPVGDWMAFGQEYLFTAASQADPLRPGTRITNIQLVNSGLCPVAGGLSDLYRGEAE